MLPGMELFFSRMSGNSGRAVFALIESGAQWQQHPLDPRVARDREPQYLALNPMGKVPALRDGAFSLWESNAINWYVAEKHPHRGLLPTSPEGRASVQRWLYFQAGHISPACISLFRASNARMQAFWNMRGDARAEELARKELERFLPVLESALEGRDWLEQEFSLADIAYAPHFQLIAEGGFSFAPYPRVAGWLERLWARPAWQQTTRLLYQD
jgi:glutathione S-transferase